MLRACLMRALLGCMVGVNLSFPVPPQAQELRRNCREKNVRTCHASAKIDWALYAGGEGRWRQAKHSRILTSTFMGGERCLAGAMGRRKYVDEKVYDVEQERWIAFAWKVLTRWIELMRC